MGTPRLSAALVSCCVFCLPAPAGDVVFMSTYALHRSPAVWEDPLAFDPDRHAPLPAFTACGACVQGPGGRARTALGCKLACLPHCVPLAPAACRFLGGREAALHRFQWLPFGAGPRVCLGATFATMSVSLMLATLMQRCCFRPLHPTTPLIPASCEPRGLAVWLAGLECVWPLPQLAPLPLSAAAVCCCSRCCHSWLLPLSAAAA